MREQIERAITQALKKIATTQIEPLLEHPRDEAHGDWSTNVALVLAKETGKNPRELAYKLVEVLEKEAQLNSLIYKIEVAGAGFINFWLSERWLLDEVARVGTGGWGKNNRLKGKRVMVEYTDPNPFKEFHIGHLMSNTVGEAIARLFEASGATVRRVCYQGDVGLHVAKAIWGYTHIKLSGGEMKKWGQAYAYGATRYEEDEAAREEITRLNKIIYDKTDDEVNKLYRAGREASLSYFELLYQRLGTKFDDYFFESEAGTAGLAVVEEALTKGVLIKGEEGAVVFPGEKYGLHTRVFRNKLGLPTYEGKELGLAGEKYAKWSYDLSYIVTAHEIDEYFKVLLKVLGLLKPELAKKTHHLSHGVMKLKSGKMSSRTGKVVTGEALLNELKEVVLLKMSERVVSNKAVVADEIAVAALKWTVLKQAIGSDIVYEPERMTKLEGDTGPYVQYTYARARSVLAKSRGLDKLDKTMQELGSQELAILRWLYRYKETVEVAAREYAPHYVAHFTLELAGRFNSFYAKYEIAGYKTRLEITRAVAGVLEDGLNLLGIATPQEM